MSHGHESLAPRRLSALTLRLKEEQKVRLLFTQI